MKYTSCCHTPLIAKIIYEGAHNSTYSLELCQACKDYPAFQKNILKVEDLN